VRRIPKWLVSILEGVGSALDAEGACEMVKPCTKPVHKIGGHSQINRATNPRVVKQLSNGLGCHIEFVTSGVGPHRVSQSIVDAKATNPSTTKAMPQDIQRAAFMTDPPL
jgi:hypothetical protein